MYRVRLKKPRNHRGTRRHGRVATDLLLEQWGRPPFTWGGGGNRLATGTARARYITALEKADRGNFAQLRAFVRS